MPGICFFYESADRDVWSDHDLAGWRYAMKATRDVRSMILVNLSGQDVTCPDTEIDFQVVTSVPVLTNAVYLVGPNEKPPVWTALWEFDHNVDWYCFGPASGWPTLPVGSYVHVPQASVGAPHAIHIATTVLLHRFFVKG